MACVNEDGTLTPTAKKVLSALEEAAPLTNEEIAAKSGLPLFKVRSVTRDMKNAGIVIESNGKLELA